MSTTPSPDDTATPVPDDSIERAGRVLAEAFSATGQVDVERLCDAHPHLADALHQLHAACSVVGHVLDDRHRSAPQGASAGARALLPAAPQRLLEQLGSRTAAVGRYRVEQEIGRGGMGVVHRVWDDDLQRPLAMKLARRGLSDPEQAQALARFLEEAQIASQLDHPGMVPVHELGVDADGEPYFTMQLVRGQTLKQVFEARARRSPAQLAGLLLKVCDAMAYAHHKGVIHRDLKPANIMVGRYGEVYVMDWGLARVLDRPDVRDLRVASVDATEVMHGLRSPGTSLYTSDGDVIGTPAYMSPEQAAGDIDALGPATDVYAVGAMLYHALAGQPPYLGPDERLPPRAVWKRVCNGPPRPLSELAPRAPPALVSLCSRAMAREPSQRLPGMEEFADQLRAFLEGRVVAAHASGAWAEVSAWCRRNRGVAMASVALLLVLIASGFVIADSERERRLVEQRERALAERDVAARRAEELVALADSLWPLHPERLPQLDAWLSEADQVLAGRAELRAELAAVRALGRPLPEAPAFAPDPQAEEREVLEITRRKIDAQLSLARQALADLGAQSAGRAAERHRETLEVLAPHAEVVARRLAELRPRPEPRVAFDDPEDARIHDVLARLERAAEALDGADGLRADVSARRAAVRAMLEQAETAHEAWSEALASIASSAECPAYGGLALQPQLGLVPLRRNPASRLWEFWHMASGARPELDSQGRWLMGPETGLVLVLLPGGSSQVGSSPLTAEQRAFFGEELVRVQEGPARTVLLQPYFLAAHELTQAQWARLTGEWPAKFSVGVWREHGPYVDTPRVRPENPVESVTWQQANAALSRWGLQLPTEAQWEHGSRAGRPGPFGWIRWPFSADEFFAKLLDLNSDREVQVAAAVGPTARQAELPSDGWILHAAVGRYPPNAFGLYDMAGNVSEWCRDWFATSLADGEVLGVSADGSAELLADEPDEKTYRGGSFRDDFRSMRHGSRQGASYRELRDDLGLRAARPLER